MPKCPKCGSEMIIKLAIYGINCGDFFYSCKKFPKCKGIKKIKKQKFIEKQIVNSIKNKIEEEWENKIGRRSTEKFACMKMTEYFEKLGVLAEFLQDDPDMGDLE